MMNERMDEATEARNRQARDRALKALRAVSVGAAPVVLYNARERVAVIGGMEAMEFAPRLLDEGLRPLVVLTEGVEEPGVPVVPLGGRSLVIEGHLGNFTLKLGEPGKPAYEEVRVDMVLDLGVPPQLTMPLPPPGYLSAGSDDQESLAGAILMFRELVGAHEKPRFFNYDPSLCAHGRNGQTACTRCIDTCPAEAIVSLGERVEVDSNRCQGGGICATVCPGGAMRYAWPDVEDSLERAKRMIAAYLEAGGRRPVLVVIPEAEAELAGSLPPNQLPFEVEELASVGLEFWLGTLGYGARQVLLLTENPLPEAVEAALDQQLAVAHRILEALGYPREALRRVPGPVSPDAGEVLPELEAARFAPVGGKRQLFYSALDHLHGQAGRARPMVLLEAGAPFGTVQVDGERCTLCNACVGACPGGALQAGTEEPAIRFVEANCLQCGLCTRTCPEDAIAISPRLLFDAAKRNEARLLHREEPFHCIQCGKPFATRSVVNRMQSALQGHWMYQDERSRQRLKMCDQCRVVDMAQDPETMLAAGGVHMDH